MVFRIKKKANEFSVLGNQVNICDKYEKGWGSSRGPGTNGHWLLLGRGVRWKVPERVSRRTGVWREEGE